jgi:adenylate kinase
MSHYDAIFMFGPQGAGKGTQTKLLADKLGFFVWDTGRELRNHPDMATSSGQKVGDILASGRLFSDEELLSVIGPLITAIPAEQGVIFDGIPRRRAQGEFLLDFLRQQGRQKLATIALQLSDEEALQRLLLRGRTEGRSDDTEEAIKYRLEQYHAETEPILEFMKANTEYFAVDGAPAVEAVAQSIEKALSLT